MIGNAAAGVNGADGAARTESGFGMGPGGFVPVFLAGIVAGLLVLILSISFAALIFSGEISQYVPTGIGLILATATITSLIVALRSSYPGTIGAPQDKIAPILALLASSIVAKMQGTPIERIFFTVIAAIALTSLITGAFLTALGRYRLGALIRFIPFPVVGGFLGGTGWLLLLGSIKTVTHKKVNLANLLEIFHYEALIKWIPCLLFALILLGAMKKIKHYLTMPLMIIAAVAIFYVALLATGTSVEQARAGGWLLSGLPTGGLFVFPPIKGMMTADWSVILGSAGGIGTVLMVSAIALLLNASAIELESEHEVNLDSELRAAGAANLVNSVFGGIVGFHSLSVSALIIKMGARSRFIGIIASAMCAFTLFFGATFISYVPMPVIGGMLMFLGFSFLREWAYHTAYQMPRSEYIILMMILVVVGTMGYLEGVAVGVVAAIVMFVVNYSRVNVVKHELNLENFRSNVDRIKEHRHILRDKGGHLLILRLNGYIFFGTANMLLMRIKSRAEDAQAPKLEYLVLDFSHVSGIDTSATMSLKKLIQLSKRQGFLTLFTHMDNTVKQQFEKAGILSPENSMCMVFETLDRGVEWCENRILTEMGAYENDKRSSLEEQIRQVVPEAKHLKRLIDRMVRIELAEGETLIKQDSTANDMYFIESGEVDVILDLVNGEHVRLRRLGAGTMVGELGLYLNIARTTSIVTGKPSVVYRLTAEDIHEIERDDPQVAANLHEFVARLLAERLHNANKTLKAVLD